MATNLNSKSRPYLIRETKEMLPRPLVLCFRSHFIHKHPWLLQGLCRQALGLRNSNNPEWSSLKINPTKVFSRASHSLKAAAGRHHTKHRKSCRLPHTRNAHDAGGEVELKLRFLKVASHASIVTQLQHLCSMNRSAQISSIKLALCKMGGIYLRGIFPFFSWLLIFICLKM